MFKTPTCADDTSVPSDATKNTQIDRQPSITYVDLFCGIGGFRIAVNRASAEISALATCVLSSDIDAECQRAYAANFGELPRGDIRALDANEIPHHDLLLAGFPCQPFSVCGDMRGFADMRGTLFFEIARILAERRPRAFVLENVKLLVGHDGGRTLGRILETVSDLGYFADYRVLNALNFGLPQKRERVFIVGTLEDSAFNWPRGGIPMTPLEQLLEADVPQKYYASDAIRQSRLNKKTPTDRITIWHENKSGHVSAYPFSCALRAGASYNYLLVNGERRLTPREMLRLQGFPDSFEVVCNDSQTRKQAGNSVPIPVVTAVLRSLLPRLLIAPDSSRLATLAPRSSREPRLFVSEGTG